MRSLAARVLLGYLVVAYALPWLAIIVTSYQSPLYKMPELGVTQIGYAFFLFMAVLLGAGLARPRAEQPRVELKAPRFGPYLIALLLLVAIVSVGYLTGLSRWRYEATGLSENLSFTSLFYVIAAPIFEAALFLEMFFFDYRQRGFEQRIIVLVLALGLVLVASGIGPMILVLAAAIQFLFPAQVRLLVFGEQTGSGTERFATKVGLVPMIGAGAVLMIIGLIVGSKIKTGTEDVGALTYSYSLTSLSDVTSYLIDRYSTALISLNVSLSEYTTFHWSDTADNLWAPIGNFLFRFDALTGGSFGVVKPYGGSLARLNYEHINYYPLNLREGTSPGLIGGFVMAFPLPLSLLMLYGYVRLLRFILDWISLALRAPTTLVGSIVVLYFTFGLFQSPLDFLLIFDPAVFTLAFFVGLAIYVRRKVKKGKPNVAAQLAGGSAWAATPAR